jgi:hypothetical protein
MANQPEIAVVEVDVEIAVEKTEEIAPKKRAKPATAKYEVINGAISPYGGGMETLIQPGSIVELPTDLAVHYNKLGYLKPYIEE